MTNLPNPFLGESDENLQRVQSGAAGRSLPPQDGEQGWPDCSLQDLRKESEAREAQTGSKSEILSEGSDKGSCAKGCEQGENSEARPVPSLLHDYTEASSGWPSQRLFETASNNVVVPQLPRSGASDLEADGGLAEPFDGADIPMTVLMSRGFDVETFLAEIEPLPLFLQAPVDVLHLLAGY